MAPAMSSVRAFMLVVSAILYSGAAQSIDSCGQGYGDVRGRHEAVVACRRCKGVLAHLVFDSGLAYGRGQTLCHASNIARAAEKVPARDGDCGEGFGDKSGGYVAASACRACLGSKAELVFKRDLGDGVGRTICQTESAESPSEAAGASMPLALNDASETTSSESIVGGLQAEFSKQLVPVMAVIGSLGTLLAVMLKIVGSLMTSGKQAMRPRLVDKANAPERQPFLPV